VLTWLLTLSDSVIGNAVVFARIVVTWKEAAVIAKLILSYSSRRYVHHVFPKGKRQTKVTVLCHNQSGNQSIDVCFKSQARTCFRMPQQVRGSIQKTCDSME
jgi:hypothetical protein